MVADTFSLSTASGGSSGNISLSNEFAANEIATVINNAAATSGNGITATATNVSYISNIGADGNIGFTLGSDDSTSANADAAVALSNVAVTSTSYSSLVTEINANFSTTGIIAEAVVMGAGDAGVKLTQVDGKDITIGTFVSDGAVGDTISIGKSATTASNSTITEGAATDSVRLGGAVSLSSSQGAIAVADALGTTTSTTASTAASLASLSITSAASAATALSTIDAALDTVNSGRGALGAIQTRFESVVASQQVASENLSASKSRIEDADFAAETASLTKAQILQQSGIAMLAQANSLPQNVLALLQ
jgi:flagellin